MQPPEGGWIQPEIDASDWAQTAAVYKQAEVVLYTGATARQVDVWAREGILGPSVQAAFGQGTRRIYSFRDILAVRILKRLSDVGVPPRNLTRAVETLRALGEDDLASTVLLSDGVTVYQCVSDAEVVDLVRGGQGVFVIPVSPALRDIRAALAAPAPASVERTGLRARRRRTRTAPHAETDDAPDLAEAS